MYELLIRYFTPALTADIGCGAGRDTAWLSKNNFEVIGYDASDELLREARQHFPDVAFEFATLPRLEEIEPRKNFQNILCETVIMHLEAQQVGAARRRLIDILRPQGTLFLSWRVTDGHPKETNISACIHRLTQTSFLMSAEDIPCFLITSQSVNHLAKLCIG